MDISSMDIVNTVPVLNGLVQILQTGIIARGVYLNRKDDTTPADLVRPAFNAQSLGVKELPLPNILIHLGIRSITLDTDYDLTRLNNLKVALPEGENAQHIWPYFRDETIIQELRALFNNCRTIAFDDWSAVTGASDLWDGLLSEVIKPTGKNNIEFIFYLGSPAGKFSFEVDEAIDLISDFSYCGKVTFALDEDEAIKLWMVLNGVKQDVLSGAEAHAELKKKYFSIYRTMKITRLLIYSNTDAMIISQEEQFALSRQKVEQHIEFGINARQDFIAGLSIGLLKEFTITRCIALGLIVFGAQGERNANSDQRYLLDYLQKWIDDLQKPDTIHLYQ